MPQFFCFWCTTRRRSAPNRSVLNDCAIIITPCILQLVRLVPLRNHRHNLVRIYIYEQRPLYSEMFSQAPRNNNWRRAIVENKNYTGAALNHDTHNNCRLASRDDWSNKAVFCRPPLARSRSRDHGRLLSIGFKKDIDKVMLSDQQVTRLRQTVCRDDIDTDKKRRK